MNFVTISGRIYKEPQLRYTPRGTAWCTFSVGVFRDEVDGMDFFDVTLWGYRGEHFYKEVTAREYPVEVTILGKLAVSEWTANDGTKRRKAFIKAQEAYVVSPVLGQESNGNGKSKANDAGNTSTDMSDIGFHEDDTDILGDTEEIPF